MDIAIASSCLDFIICQHYATCNAVMKFQYMNGLSPTHSNDLLNALLECIKFYLYIHIVFLLTYLNCFIHLTYSQLFINCFFLTETGLEGVYLISQALSIPKTTFNKYTYELACQYS